MDGNVKGVILDTFDAVSREDISCVGVGMNMEAVEDNEILFEAISYNSVRSKAPDLDKFLEDYVCARFGKKYPNMMKALRMISDEILTLGNRTYNAERAATCYRGRESGLCTAPSLSIDRVTYSSKATKVLYDNEILAEVLRLMLESYDEQKNNQCYLFDITDIARQINSNHSWELLDLFREAFKRHDYECFEKYSNEFLELYDIQEAIMQKLPEKSFNIIVEKARKMGRNPREENMFIYNWLKLIFNFQLTSHPVTDLDYGHLECSGLLIAFYKKRWEIYIEMMRYYFDTPEDLPTVAWADYAENFIFEQMIRKERPKSALYSYEDCMKKIAKKEL